MSKEALRIEKELSTARIENGKAEAAYQVKVARMTALQKELVEKKGQAADLLSKIRASQDGSPEKAQHFTSLEKINEEISRLEEEEKRLDDELEALKKANQPLKDRIERLERESRENEQLLKMNSSL